MTMTLERALDVLRVVTSRAMQGSETRDAYDCVVSHLTQSAQSVAAKDAEIERLQAGFAKHVDRVCELQSRLAAANAQLRLMHRVLSQAVCVACADDGGAKDHELDKLEGVLRDQGWITSAVVPSAPNLQGAGDE